MAEPKPVAYVCGPYRDDRPERVAANVRHAHLVGVALLRLGFAVIVPHLNTGGLEVIVPEQTLLEAALDLLRRGDLVVCCVPEPVAMRSEGTRRELLEADRVCLPVVYWDSAPGVMNELLTDWLAGWRVEQRALDAEIEAKLAAVSAAGRMN
ncbi:MAG: hypothetical protein M1401_03410 [Chloroflexi bacterium]|nr:hypothetical protein [Chloroflexota bacterium]MCL5107914.1 hypothetical protein [Chloroflexota bacterium]